MLYRSTFIQLYLRKWAAVASSGDQTRASMDLLDSGSSKMFLVKVIFSDKVLVEKKHGNGSWCCGVSVVKEALSNGSSPTTSNNQTPTQSYSLEMSGGLDPIGSNSTRSFEANAWRFGLQAAKFTLPGPVTAWALLPVQTGVHHSSPMH